MKAAKITAPMRYALEKLAARPEGRGALIATLGTRRALVRRGMIIFYAGVASLTVEGRQALEQKP